MGLFFQAFEVGHGNGGQGNQTVTQKVIKAIVEGRMDVFISPDRHKGNQNGYHKNVGHGPFPNDIHHFVQDFRPGAQRFDQEQAQHEHGFGNGHHDAEKKNQKSHKSVFILKQAFNGGNHTLGFVHHRGTGEKQIKGNIQSQHGCSQARIQKSQGKDREGQ